MRKAGYPDIFLISVLVFSLLVEIFLFWKKKNVFRTGEGTNPPGPKPGADGQSFTFSLFPKLFLFWEKKKVFGRLATSACN